MPFLWKKVKGSRISQLVADRFNSSKHGGSLVVQTGFPTSLIDLFHKNRDRLKKSAKKKRSSGDDLPAAAGSTPFTARNSLSYCNSESELVNSQECLTKLVSPETELLTPERCSTNPQIELLTPERCFTNQIEDDLVSGKRVKVVEDTHKVFIALLKILFVVILALGTKRLVVGVSLSAFTLYLLEYVGNCVYNLSKLCPDYKKWLRAMVGRVLCSVRIKGEMLEGQDIESDCGDSVKGLDLDVQSLERQIVEIVPVVDNEIMDNEIKPKISMDSDNELEFGRMDSKIGSLKKEDECRTENKREGSRRAKMTSKMRKLVPKKLCKTRRKGAGLEGGVFESTKGDEDIDKDQGKDAKQIECDEELCNDKVDKISEVTSDSCELKQSDSEAIVVVAEARRETVWISKYWLICLIVLSGLVGGRIFAIVFTLCWCLILKPLGNKGDVPASSS